MNELQQTEFELLREFDRVCKMLDLNYFLVCGSALGAVKYGGFIPWDDDIDLGMYREDYERFCREAPALLPEHLFLQNFRSEPALPQIYSKLRNSNTTYIEKTAAKLPINHGVFLDIFPLDGYPRNKVAGKWLEFRKRLYGSMLLAAYDLPDGGARKLWRLLGLHKHSRAVVKALDRMIRRYPVDGSEWICNHGNWQGMLEYAPVWQYGKGSIASFEGMMVRIPENYDAYLRQKYNDYTAELPPEKQVGHHTWSVMDCREPYTKYRSQEKGA
jgi:lipopolysaccharide cholinephosphotransferase